MYRKFMFYVGLAAAVCSAAQAHDIDYGTSTGSQTTGIQDPSTLLPSAPNGTARTRIGTGAGSFILQTASIGGTGSEFKITAPTGGSINKYSIYGITGGTGYFIKFKLRLGGTSGNQYLFIGNGANFSDNNTFSGSQMFSAIQWVMGAGGVTTNYRNGASWSTLPTTTFAINTTYDIEIVANNSTSTVNYAYNGARSVGANKWDLWVDGVLVNDELAPAQLASGTSITGIMFYSESSVGNVATMTLDDLHYETPIPSTVPVEVSGFTIE